MPVIDLIVGDCREVLRSLPAGCIQSIVTSPPYFNLRDYGVAGQIGLETSPDAYVQELVSVFREARRVLRDDGTLWLNLGDSYAGSGRGGNPTRDSSTLEGGHASQEASMVKRTRPVDEVGATARDAAVTNVGRRNTRGSQLPAGLHEKVRQGGAIGRAWVPPPAGYKQKDLMGMPWRVAFALQADGWFLRQDIIWAKPNPMPESVMDRCTKAHEYVFLMAKSPRYYFDGDAIATPVTEATKKRLGQPNLANQAGSERVPGKTNGPMKALFGGRNKHDGYGTRIHSGNADTGTYLQRGANKRSVWQISTTPFKGAHFATFPIELAETCILAGCPAGGAVLDPFAGAGTTGLAADRLGRHALLIELNPEFAQMAADRINARRA